MNARGIGLRWGSANHSISLSLSLSLSLFSSLATSEWPAVTLSDSTAAAGHGLHPPPGLFILVRPACGR